MSTNKMEEYSHIQQIVNLFRNRYLFWNQVYNCVRLHTVRWNPFVYDSAYRKWKNTAEFELMKRYPYAMEVVKNIAKKMDVDEFHIAKKEMEEHFLEKFCTLAQEYLNYETRRFTIEKDTLSSKYTHVNCVFTISMKLFLIWDVNRAELTEVPSAANSQFNVYFHVVAKDRQGNEVSHRDFVNDDEIEQYIIDVDKNHQSWSDWVQEKLRY